MRRNSGIIGSRQSTTSSTASGVFESFDQYNAKYDNVWPQFQIESISNSNGSNLDEQATSTITVTTSGVPDSTTLYYTIATVSGTALVAADFANGLSGSFEINSNSGSFNINPIGDDLSESNVAKIEIRRGSISGQILIETGNLTIGDAAAPVGDDITSSFYEISNRFINSQTYMGTSSDYNGPYDVGEVQTDFTGSGRVYIGVKVTASTTFYNDIPIAGVQVISSNGSTLLASWIFNTSTGGSGSGWATYGSQIPGTSTQGFPVTPATASAYGYSTMSTGVGTGKFGFRNSTGSSYTGADNGISNSYKLSSETGGSNTLATVGNATVSQTSNTYYAYRETSGSTRWSGTVMRSPAYTFSGGEYIRVIHAVTGPTSMASTMDGTDSLYVAVY